MGRILNARRPIAFDEKLVEAAREGDRVAWRGLIEATQNRIYRFCLTLCGDPVRAEDLCQEAYLKAFANLNKLHNPDVFVDWIFRVTRNIYIDQLRSNREDATENIEEPVHSSEHATLMAVHETLSRFEPEERWLLVLIDMEGYTYREAAEMLGVSEDAVRSRLFRLRELFVKKWQERETK